MDEVVTAAGGKVPKKVAMLQCKLQYCDATITRGTAILLPMVRSLVSFLAQTKVN